MALCLIFACVSAETFNLDFTPEVTIDEADILKFGVTDVPKFVAGMVMGIIHKNDMSEIEKCFAGSTDLTNAIIQAVKDFSSGGMTGILAGLKDIGVIVMLMPDAFSHCTNISDDLTKLKKWAAIFTHPADLASTIAKNLLFHFSEITKAVSAGVKDFKAQQYFDSGNDFGTALTLAIGKAAPQFE